LLFFLLKKKSFSIIYPVTAFLLFTASVTVKVIHTGRNNELIVYNTPGYSTVGIITGRKINLYSDRLTVPPEVMRHGAALGLRIEKQKLDCKPRLIKAGNDYIFITDSLRSSWQINNMATFIILTGGKPVIDRKISQLRLKDAEIITTMASSSFHLPYPLILSYSRSLWSVRESGAYRRSL
jgi:hypothetical protein